MGDDVEPLCGVRKGSRPHERVIQQRKMPSGLPFALLSCFRRRSINGSTCDFGASFVSVMPSRRITRR